MLHPETGVPLYRQLADELEARIGSGKIRPGERIPSEPELAETYGIGRPTVRQATDWLVRRGLVERRRGAGTFVLRPRDPVDWFQLTGTRAAFASAGLNLEVTIVEPLSVQERLGVDSGPLAHQPGYAFARLGRVDGVPVFMERVRVSQAAFPGFERCEIEQESLALLVERHYRRRPSAAQETLRVLALTPRDAAHLGVKAGHPALVIERVLDFPGAPRALFVQSQLRTDRVVLTQTRTEPSAAFGMALLPEKPR